MRRSSLRKESRAGAPIAQVPGQQATANAAPEQFTTPDAPEEPISPGWAYAAAAAALAATLLATDPGQAVTPDMPGAHDPDPTNSRHSVPVPDAPQANKYAHFRHVAEHLSRRFLVSTDAIEEMVEVAHHAGARVKIDPLLILAVAAVESSFNPIAESVAGAKGLMQVIPKYHQDKFAPLGGDKAVLDPRANILVGALILREYLDRTGDLTAALQRYAGAPADPENRYTRKVMTEHQRLNQVVTQLHASGKLSMRGTWDSDS